MLHLQHNILPSDNLLPSSYAAALQVIEPFLVKPLTFHACPKDCILFHKEYKDNRVCPKCQSDRYTENEQPVRKFVYLPLGSRLMRMFGTKNLAQIIQSHSGPLLPSTNYIYDLHDSLMWKETYSVSGPFKGDLRGLSFGLCTDGVNPFSHNRVAYSMWPIMLTLLNLPRDKRNKFGNIFLLGIIPGNGSKEPLSIDPYMQVVVDELLELSTSKEIFDAYQCAPFNVKAEILIFMLDYPCIGKVLKMSGSGAYKGCVWCEIKGICCMLSCWKQMQQTFLIFIGTYCSELHKVVYLQNRRYLPPVSSLRHEEGFPQQSIEMNPPPTKRQYSKMKGFHDAIDKASRE